MKKIGLKRIINFYYNVDDCLFDAITYLLKYAISSKMIGINSMSHLQECLTLGTPKGLKCHAQELNFDFFA